jgi:hypothetical protein
MITLILHKYDVRVWPRFLAVQDKDKLRPLVMTVINIRELKDGGGDVLFYA